MADRPIILFGQPSHAARTTRRMIPGGVRLPSHARQSARLAPKMTALQNTLVTLQQTAVGIEPEKALVFELAKDIKAFYTAVKHLGDGIEVIFDVPQNIDIPDDFYVTERDRYTNEITRSNDRKSFNGKVYCVLTNARALQEILQLWTRYSHDMETEFPRGKGGLKHVFDCLVNVHPWGYKERIEETGILDAWREDLHDPNIGTVKCEIELFFRSSPEARRQRESDLSEKITSLGGSILRRSEIPDIAYHAVLVDLPRTSVEQIMRNDKSVSILSTEQIMFFRPVGQSVLTAKGDDTDININVPDAEGINKEPIVALFDGLPQENHPFLANRLMVDDPDGYTTHYQVADRKHGTSMASLIALGDLPSIRQATHRIYVRPIMKPKQMPDESIEEVPDDVLLVDRIHEAVRRLFVAETGAVAPSVKVINLSIGIEYRQFDRSMSPLARLLDWLSYKYRVLFVVSAGNINDHLNDWNIGISFADYASLSIAERDKKVVEWVNGNSRNMRLLSPAESMNALTVGAPCSQGMISPISAIGKGLNNSVKPDIVYHGGRCAVSENIISHSPKWLWQAVTREPGTQSAAPTTPGSSIKTAFSLGTSNAAALVSHEASRCYDALIDVFAEAGRDVPNEYIALLIKAMLVHGSGWGALKDILSQSLGLVNRSQYSDVLYRFIGYGKPEVDKAIECAPKRITLIGYGSLKDGEAHLYDLPLPFDFNRGRITRRLTATLTYFPPIVPSRQDYRSAQVWFANATDKPHFLDSRVDANDKAVTRGSVQHEIFENDAIVAWGEDDTFQIKVNCRAVAVEHLTDAIPYALMVSFEIRSDIDVDVYTRVADRVRPRVPAI